MKKNRIATLEQFKEKHYGKTGTARRDKLEKDFHDFSMGTIVYQARLEKGLTQEDLAEKCGTNKAFILRIESDIKGLRISTLQKIVEVGLGGQLNLSIKL